MKMGPYSNHLQKLDRREKKWKFLKFLYFSSKLLINKITTKPNHSIKNNSKEKANYCTEVAIANLR